MKGIIRGMLSLTIFSMIIFVSFLFGWPMQAIMQKKYPFKTKKDILENKISDIAERYVGIPYGFGKDLEKYRALDNSHLLCLIYHEAAKQAGLRFKGYMPIKSLLRNTVEVRRDELKNGDLIGC